MYFQYNKKLGGGGKFLWIEILEFWLFMNTLS